MKRVLVIGANSYIGRNFYNYTRYNNVNEIETFLVSAADGSWENIDFSQYNVVLHLAAIVHKKEKKSMEKLYFDVNHKLAVDIAKHAKDSGIQQFIFMSTAAVYGKRLGCITKDTLPNPITFYGKSKLAAEKDILELQNEDFKVAIIRPPMVYGEGCKGNYLKLLKVSKYMLVFPDLHNKRSVVNINLLCSILEKIILQESTGYFFPQDDKYFDIVQFVVNTRKTVGKNIFTVKCYNKLLIHYVKKNFFISKIFGNFYYDISDK